MYWIVLFNKGQAAAMMMKKMTVLLPLGLVNIAFGTDNKRCLVLSKLNKAKVRHSVNQTVRSMNREWLISKYQLTAAANADEINR